MSKVYSFYEEHARRWGLEAAVIIYNLQMLTDKHAANGDSSHFHEGRYYVNYTYDGLHKMFPYITKRKIRTIINKLKEDGAIGVEYLSKNHWDRTPYYCLLEPLTFVTSEGDTFVTSSTYNKHKNNTHKGSVLFEDFWKVYPRKDGKAGAEKKWASLGDEARNKAIKDCVVRYKGTEKQYIPYGSTYLNQRYWEDEMPDTDTVTLNDLEGYY